jgi:hypothetical protein
VQFTNVSFIDNFGGGIHVSLGQGLATDDEVISTPVPPPCHQHRATTISTVVALLVLYGESVLKSRLKSTGMH